jgi:hypothetical protein
MNVARRDPGLRHRRLRGRGRRHPLGLLDARRCTHPRRLADHRLEGGAQDHVFMTGPATTVFEGQIEIPDAL